MHKSIHFYSKGPRGTVCPWSTEDLDQRQRGRGQRGWILPLTKAMSYALTCFGLHRRTDL